MYVVSLINDGMSTIVHEPGDSDIKLANAKIGREVNKFDSFNFTIYPNNPGYNEITPFATSVTVVNAINGETVFEGRVINPAPSMDSEGIVTKDVTCESTMGYLCDSVQDYVEETHYNTLKTYITLLLNKHNSKVEDYKKIYVGNITLQTFATSTGVTKSVSRGTTWSNIEEKLINSFGGEMRIRRASDGKLYLDYAEKLGTERATRIELARNMQDGSREIDFNSTITRLYPYGAKKTETVVDENGQEVEQETEERVTIASINSGKEYIDDAVAIEEYGIIEGYVEFDDITLPQNLLSRAQEYLGDLNLIPTSHSFTALDLSLLGLDYDDFQLYDSYPCYNPLIDVDETLEIVSQTIDINEPMSSSIEMGETGFRLSHEIDKGNIYDQFIDFQGKTETQIINISNKTVANAAAIKIFNDAIQSTVEQKVTEVVTTEFSGIITSAKTQYYVSNSATSQTGGSWSDNPPTWQAGKYIWVRQVYTKYDGSTVNGAAACLTGAPGANGQPGAPGAPGQNGNGISSTSVTYQAHNSQTSKPTGAWLSTIPALSTNKPYLWTRTIVYYTDGTSSTSYSVSSTLEGISIGSKNLLLETEKFDYASSNSLSGALRTGSSIAQDESYNGLVVRGGSNIANMIAICEYNFTDFKPGDMFTFSFWAKGNINTFRCYFYGSTGYAGAKAIAASEGSTIANPNYSDGNTQWNNGPSADWSRYWVTWEINPSATEGQLSIPKYVLIRTDGATGGALYVCGCKFERGNVATDWTPAPEDVNNHIGNVNDELQGAINTTNENLNQTNQNVTDINNRYDDIYEITTTNVTKITEMLQTIDGWDFTWEETTEIIKELDGLVSTEIDTRIKYIRFVNGEIWLGEDPEPGEDDYKVRITNERISFMQNNIEIAYISGQRLYISEAQILNRLIIGEFAFYPRDNGNMSLRYIGGQ